MWAPPAVVSPRYSVLMTEITEGAQPTTPTELSADVTVEAVAAPIERWNWVWMDLEERISEFGPGYGTRAEAIRATRSVVQDIAADFPEFRPAALAWIRGETTDDTLIGGPHGYALYRFNAADEWSRKESAESCLKALADRAGVKLPKKKRR